MPSPLSPGFMVVHSNHPESLRSLFVDWTRRHALGPLEDEVVLVQSNGIAQWLKLALAANPDDGGQGIAAALRTELPAQFQWTAYSAVLGESLVPRNHLPALEKPQLIWRLMRLLPDLRHGPDSHGSDFRPLFQFLDNDPDQRKLHQLAERLADLFDQYQVYRADWLEAWTEGKDEYTARGQTCAVPSEQRWQPQLWRAILQDIDTESDRRGRVAVHHDFLAAVEGLGDTRPPGLPRRLVIFGITSLPQQTLDVLVAISRWTQVMMLVHNPCEHDWSHIASDKDLLRQQRRRQNRRPGSEGEITEDAMHLHAHPLLAAWGKQGRDFIALLSAKDDVAQYQDQFSALGQRVDCFNPTQGDTLLRQLQDDIRDLRPLSETRSLWPAVPATDRSIQFHIAHSPQREVEILHNQLLAAFAADSTLTPRDVIVMVPDIAAYAPHIEAVFGMYGSNDTRHIPYSITDRGQRGHDPLLAALEMLLSLRQSRLGASDVLDLLEVPAVRQRFGIQDAQLPLLQRWIRGAGVRWALHAEQRASLGLPADSAQNTWDFGLQRMLLGYAVGTGEGWQEVEPLDEVGGLDAALLGPLTRLLRELDSHWRLLATPGPPAEWGQRLRHLLQAFFLADGKGDGYTLIRLSERLGEWERACEAANLNMALPLAVVREHWLSSLDRGDLSRPFFGGAVTFATLMPMRAIPFRQVALLGMNDGDYPRSRVPADFDLMAHDWRAGDRSRREDDRYLFLEALLSARDHLLISWVGRSVHDNALRPPSVLVAQLRDHLAAGWTSANSKALLESLTVEHPLQPFHPECFFEGSDPRLVSYADEWLAAPRASSIPAPLPERLPEGPLTLEQVTRFLKDPARHFMVNRLGVHFPEARAEADDHETFAIDALENWRLQDELISAQQFAVWRGEPEDQALGKALQRIARRGDLPAGAFGRLAADDIKEPMPELFAEWRKALESWPTLLPPQAVDWLPADTPESLRLVDWIEGIRTNGDKDRCRLLLSSTSLVDGSNHYRRDKLIPAWITHVAAHLTGDAMTTYVISKKGSISLIPLQQAAAREYWDLLIKAWRVGLTRPLPLSPCTGFEAIKPDGDKARKAYEGDDFTRSQFGKSGERDNSPWLARAFPDFDSLTASGELFAWADQLLSPLLHVTPQAKSKSKEASQ